MIKQYENMTHEQFIEYLSKYTIDGCHPRICDEAAERLKKLPPCNVGDKVAVRALCECVYTTPNNDECRYECPFENDCECEECDNSNERIFVTEVSSIYNEGYGWVITFKGLSIEARQADINTSFFVGENAEQQAEEYNKMIKERDNK